MTCSRTGIQQCIGASVSYVDAISSRARSVPDPYQSPSRTGDVAGKTVRCEFITVPCRQRVSSFDGFFLCHVYVAILWSQCRRLLLVRPANPFLPLTHTEAFPLHVREIGMSFATSVCRSFSFGLNLACLSLVVKSVPPVHLRDMHVGIWQQRLYAGSSLQKPRLCSLRSRITSSLYHYKETCEVLHRQAEPTPKKGVGGRT